MICSHTNYILVHTGPVVLAVVSKMKNFSRSQAVMCAVKVVISCNWGKIHNLVRTQIQQQQQFYGPLFGTTRVSRYQKKHSRTHHPDHHPTFNSFFHLVRSVASFPFNLRAWQSFCTTSLQDLFGLPLGQEPSTITTQTADINEQMTEVLRLTRVIELAVRRGKDSEPLQPQPYIICNSGNGMCI